MEAILTRAPFLYPSSLRSLLQSPHCFLPITQNRPLSRRLRRRTKPNKGKPPTERLFNLTAPPLHEVPNPSPKPAPASFTASLSNTVPKPLSQPPQQKPKPNSPFKPAPRSPSTKEYVHHAIESVNSYWMTAAPTSDNLATANAFFTSPKTSAKFLLGAAKFREMPSSTIPEVTFLGRSNVGKSSLLNSVLNGDFAHTSARPGRTRTMNMYGLGGVGGGGASLKKDGDGYTQIVGKDGLVVVDMPGYGYASQEGWGTEILKYLTQRTQLRRAFLLLDAEHGLKAADAQLLRLLHASSIPYQIILSKADKVYVPKPLPLKEIVRYASNGRPAKPHGSRDALRKTMNRLREEIRDLTDERATTLTGHTGLVAEMLACSSEVKIAGRLMGIDAVRWAIMKAAFNEDPLGRAAVENGRIRPFHIASS
ncbi:P-loop containing nucleoside triphosphate hydrolase protein [Delitschia confertaspora ATCC 74209]|uniref:GTP-binding protein 8 n=1 Tax=Delitschia confertaspora ATCC 74209 TaxID=1513339 RepID=A0A9P4MUS2_9PLEO|nr:P-loop containing nucleoside triphosphate hydrolase protein [Delitschia confertaspora ATCC 74209]